MSDMVVPLGGGVYHWPDGRSLAVRNHRRAGVAYVLINLAKSLEAMAEVDGA